MEFLDIGIDRPAILPPTILITMVFLMMELLNCLWVMEDVDIGLYMPSTLHLAIMEFIIVVIKVVTTIEFGIGIKRQATLPLIIMEKYLMFPVEVDIGLRTATRPPITQVAMVYISGF